MKIEPENLSALGAALNDLFRARLAEAEHITREVDVFFRRVLGDRYVPSKKKKRRRRRR